ncbi:MAG: hypothetical protein Q4F97_12285 [Bacteroidales bacterium]|nr:hypothetical protein [Bacteroidales bacterium]
MYYLRIVFILFFYITVNQGLFSQSDKTEYNNDNNCSYINKYILEKARLLNYTANRVFYEVIYNAINVNRNEKYVIANYQYLDATEIINCDNINELRDYFQNSPSNTVYNLPNGGLITYISVYPDCFDIYIQDVSGGIIFRVALNWINLPFIDIGSRIKNIKGFLTLVDGYLTLVPINNFEIISDLEPYPQNVRILDLMLNPDSYDASLVQIDNITAQNPDLHLLYNNYYLISESDISRSSKIYIPNIFSTAVYTHFFNVDYIGKKLPDKQFSIKGIVNYNFISGEVTITPRFQKDILSEDRYQSIKSVYSYKGLIYINKSNGSHVKISKLSGEVIYDNIIINELETIEIDQPGIYIVTVGARQEKVYVE